MWFDRLTQQALNILPSQIESGRFQWRGKSNECLNGHTLIAPGELLFSDGAERCQLNSGCYSFLQASSDRKAIVTLFDNAITTIGKQLDKKSGELISPMLPAAVIDSESGLLPVERTLSKILADGHLHQISYRPRLDVHYDEEVTDVARAKRLAKGALVHLASHSECWQRQTLNGVVPKKVKARFSEDDFHIYENRVYARLLDKLEKHLGLRIRTVEQLNSTMDQALTFYDNKELHHRLSHKICTLWGQTFDEEATLETMALLEETLYKLKAMQQSIRNLKQNGLYLRVSRQAEVGAALHRTNILNHDAHYRHLAILWDELNCHQQKSQLPPAGRFQHQQHLARYYSDYAGLVLQQALQPYFADEQKAIFHSDKLRMNWAGKELTLERENYDWRLLVLRGDRPPETLLHLISWIGFSEFKPISVTTKNTLVAWPALNRVLDDRPMSDDHHIAMSPLDLYCIERAGWYIDQMLNQILMKGYAKPIDRIPREPTERFRQSQTAHSIALSGTSPPSLKILEDISDDDLVSLQQVFQTSNAHDKASALVDRVLEIRALQTCPVCGSVQNRLRHQPPDGFRIECNKCCSRYLKTGASQKEFELKMPSEFIANSFLVRGRWYTP